MATAPQQRPLIALALVTNVLIVVSVADWQPEGVPFAVLLAALPAVLFALERCPAAYRLVAVLLGGAYAVIGLLTWWVGGLVMLPAAVAVLCVARRVPAGQARLWHVVGVALVLWVAVAVVLVSVS